MNGSAAANMRKIQVLPQPSFGDHKDTFIVCSRRAEETFLLRWDQEPTAAVVV